MVWANLGGVIGMTLAVASGWVFQLWLGPGLFGQHEDLSVYSIHFSVLIASVFGLSFDRYDGTRLVQGYRQALAEFFESLYPGDDARAGLSPGPSCRIAWFAVPLAFGPLYLALGSILFFAVDYGSGARLGTINEYVRFFATSGLAAIIWLAFARVSRDWRDMGRRQRGHTSRAGEKPRATDGRGPTMTARR